MIESVMVARVGEAAKFTKEERSMIETGAAECLAKISPKSVKTITAFSAPVMLGTGIFMYAMRISSVSAVKSARNAEPLRPDNLRRERPNTPRNGPVPVGVVAETQPRTVFVPSGPTTNGASNDQDGSGIVDPELGDMWQEVAHNV
jgi:hypothetical protein